MPGSIAKTVKIIFVFLFLISFTSYSQNSSVPKIREKLFMIFVTPIAPPPGSVELPVNFSNECFRLIKLMFDSTSFQAVMVPSAERAIQMSNQKKDIIITTDSLDRFTMKNNTVIMALWMRYRVGLLHSRVDASCFKGMERDLPQAIANGVYKAVKNEFTGVLELEGGPQGMTVILTDGVCVTPPRSMLFPPGDYYITSSYPYFKTRTDTIEVYQGRVTKKRILLLPEDQ